MTAEDLNRSIGQPALTVEDIEAGGSSSCQTLQEGSCSADVSEGLSHEEIEITMDVEAGAVHQTMQDVEIHRAELPIGLASADDQDYSKDCRATQESETGLTKRETVLLLVVIMVGAGVLAFPHTTAICGYIAAPIACIVVVLAYAEVAELLHASMMVDETIKTFEALGSYAVGCTGVVLVRICRTSMFFGYMVVYIILLAQNLGEAIPLDIPDKAWMAVVLPFVVVLAMVKDFKAMAKLMPLGFAMAAGSCILICVFSVMDAHVWQAWTPDEQSRVHTLRPQSVTKLGQGVAVIFASFAIMGNVPEIHSKMADRAEFPSAMRIALAVTCFVYLAVMACGHYAYGEFAQGNVIVNIMYSPSNADQAFSDKGYKGWDGPPSEVQGNILAGMVSVNLLLTFPSFIVIVAGVFELCDEKGVHAVRIPGTCANRLVRATIVLAAVGIAAVVPNFEVVLPMFASVFSSANNVFLPMLFAYQIKDAAGRRQVYELFGAVRRVLHVAVLLLAVFCAVFGFWGAVASLVEKFN